MKNSLYKIKQFNLLIKHDWVCGILFRWRKYIPVTAVFAVICGIYLQMANTAMLNGKIRVRPNLADYIIQIFKGMDIYIPGKGNVPFYIPGAWLILQIYIVYLVSCYPFSDLYSYGQQILLRCKSRKQWWFSKCIWVCSSVILFYLLGYLIIFVFALCSGGISLKPNIGLNLYLSKVNSSKLNPQSIIIISMILTILTSIALSLFQMLISFCSNSIIGSVSVISILVFSAYRCSPFLIGNYLMILRNSFVICKGVKTQTGIILDSCLIILCLVIGSRLFSKCDILTKKLNRY